MTDFDLDKFLKNYKPKKLDLTLYLKYNKLKGYRLLHNKDIDKLVPNRMHINYIRRCDAFMDKMAVYIYV